jgi:hypothetical protein
VHGRSENCSNPVSRCCQNSLFMMGTNLISSDAIFGSFKTNNCGKWSEFHGCGNLMFANASVGNLHC